MQAALVMSSKITQLRCRVVLNNGYLVLPFFIKLVCRHFRSMGEEARGVVGVCSEMRHGLVHLRPLSIARCVGLRWVLKLRKRFACCGICRDTDPYSL